MLNSQYILFETILGMGGTRCLRWGQPLTKPKNIERVYGLVCWQKIEIVLWLGDMVVPEMYTSTPRIPKKARNSQLVEPLEAVHRTLDDFFLGEVTPHLAEAPIPRGILVEG